MKSKSNSILFVHTYYPEFLKTWYETDPTRAGLPFETQRRRLLATRFGLSDACSSAMQSLGWESQDLIVNADPLQATWASQHGLTLTGNVHDQRRQIVAAQVADISPDVVYVFEWSPLGDAFVGELKADARMLVGQIASPLPPDRNFDAYDLMVSSWPPIVDHFRKRGQDSIGLRLAFDDRVLATGDEHAEPKPFVPIHDVTFVGGFAPSHSGRQAWLERLLEAINIDVFGYGASTVPADSPVHRSHRGQAWGLDMYDILRRSRITLNRHARIDVDGTVSTAFANNMRLYEATGIGTCLLTEHRDNIAELFEPQRDILTYKSNEECVEKLRHYLENEPERLAIANAGQRRTLAEHTYAHRMTELSNLLRERL